MNIKEFTMQEETSEEETQPLEEAPEKAPASAEEPVTGTPLP